jgi:hypothetical protein
MRFDNQGRAIGPASQMKGGDTLKQRDNNEDSITIFYRFFDSSRIYLIDSSVGDFYKRFPLPADHLYLGSLGIASRPLLFSPNLRPGFDPGFHAYDAFAYHLEGTRIFQTTRPYTEFDYILGSRAEQTIQVLHTQNLKPTWNAGFEFRYAGSPGNFKNGNSSHSNVRLSSGFSTRNRRYSGNFIYITNRNRASTNGGIVSDTFLTSSNAAFSQRFNIPTWLGGDGDFGTNFFATNINTGHEYQQRVVFFRHQYDLGQQDSLLNPNDSTVTRVFYPRFRMQHSFSFRNGTFSYADAFFTDTNSAYAQEIYGQRFGVSDLKRISHIREQWKDLSNEFALIGFPEKNNLDQFFKAGAGFQWLSGRFDTATTRQYNNLYLLGEYRNRTRNRKWDINAHARLYLAGLNAGDFTLSASLQTSLGKRAGILQLEFQNTNRTPSFVFDSLSAFVNQSPATFNKENWTRFAGTYYLPQARLKLNGNYYLVSNYTYWDSYTTYKQEGTLTSVLMASAEKAIRLSRRWTWYTALHVQTETSDAINLPVVYTRNRIAYEGVFYKNLNLSTGVEFRYFTPFTADDFSPFNGQWVVQDTTSISNRPDVSVFLNFRIRSFRLFARLDNLNTLDLSRGFGFLNNNHAAPLYPTPGLFLRLGIYWTFVN